MCMRVCVCACLRACVCVLGYTCSEVLLTHGMKSGRRQLWLTLDHDRSMRIAVGRFATSCGSVRKISRYMKVDLHVKNQICVI